MLLKTPRNEGKMMNLKLIVLTSFFLVIFIMPISTLAGQVILNKQVDKSKAKPGEIITYSITYQNPGTQTLNEVSIIDVIPSNTIFQEATGNNTTIYYWDAQNNNFATSSTSSTTKVKWVIGSVGEGGRGTVTLRVRIK